MMTVMNHTQNKSGLTKRQLETHRKLQNDLPFYASKALKIRDKDGVLVPFNFFKSQHYIHEKLEQQRKKTGMVRAYLVKARQIRGSSYVQGRYFHKCVFNPGIRTFILTHRDDSTDNLFSMAKTFNNNLPPVLKPDILSDSGSKLEFRNGSRYALGTAASPDVGRSMTVQLFHGSEVAFWKYSDQIQTGIMQTIADVPGTEIIFESTANGPRGMFHQGVKNVLSGKDKKFIVIFIPWFWESVYTSPVPDDFTFNYTDDELHLKEVHNLTDGQLYWRREKITELQAEWKFKQEYPANVIEAFQTSQECLINPAAIDDARKSKIQDPGAPALLGIDPASSKDRHPFVIRRGRHLEKVISHPPMTGTKAAYITQNLINEHNIDRVFIDCTKDLSLYDNLCAMGYRDMVIKVHFNESPLDTNRFVNKRAEMIYAVKEWIESGDVNIPDNDEIHAELMCIPHEEISANGKIYFPPKKKIIEEYGMSPDVFDAIALTFAYPVRRKIVSANGTPFSKFRKAEHRKSKSPLSTINEHKSRQFKIKPINNKSKNNSFFNVKFKEV